MSKTYRPLALLALALAIAAGSAAAQNPRPTDDEQQYSDSDARAATTTARRARTAATATSNDETPTDILRRARRLYVEPNRHLDAEYLEYKLAKLPEFAQWRLSIVKSKDRADLVLTISKKALNYIFHVVEPESTVVVTTGKVVAINGLVAAEDISHEIVKKMRHVRALPTDSRP
ncbi:MAG: hypothetical protein ACRD9R_17960 [Pyrinomonadaceae bacterium]